MSTTSSHESPAHHHLQEQLYESRGRVKRTLYISGLALINAIIVGFIAKGLILLINLITQLFFFGTASIHEVQPGENHLGYGVIIIPVIGGLIVGLMARFGSRAIRGHGIPEAMEKIIKEESRIHPLITILKPLSAALSIGTGGPFGAEGPIISTGGALGSFCGQTLHITAQERKVLLAAGATAGMTAIFGTPFAAILLAIELLLFEFSARSFVPVMIACVTGACMHFLLFGTEPTFPMPAVPQADTPAVVAYGIIGLITGFASVVVTKTMYWIEDTFEKIPVHWMCWPAIGGIAVGVIGFFFPKTLGVGYSNITNALSGQLTINILVSLCFWKFLSWAIALGSGTSGGTLAPLLTIGSSVGCLLGIAGQYYFPDAHISLPLAALVGMAALFAGAARALLTSIVFAMETTVQESTLLPLIAGCVTSYMISFILMRSTIMTEKIKRRGVLLPESYHPDVLELKTVADILTTTDKYDILVVKGMTPIRDVAQWLRKDGSLHQHNTLFVVGEHDDIFRGITDVLTVMEHGAANSDNTVQSLVQEYSPYVFKTHSLQTAVELMLRTEQDILPVVEQGSGALIGAISAHDILKGFENRLREERTIERHISVKHSAITMLQRSRSLFKPK